MSSALTMPASVIQCTLATMTILISVPIGGLRTLKVNDAEMVGPDIGYNFSTVEISAVFYLCGVFGCC
jgi:hypothetical protein